MELAFKNFEVVRIPEIPKIYRYVPGNLVPVNLNAIKVNSNSKIYTFVTNVVFQDFSKKLHTFVAKVFFFLLKILYYLGNYLFFSFQKILFSYFPRNNNIRFPQILQK